MLLTPTSANSDSGTDAPAPLLKIRGLCVYFFLRRGIVRAVDGLNLDVAPGEAAALVGESGSGKSVTAQAILRLLPPSTSRIVDGEMWFKGQDLLAMSDRQMREVRGAQIAIVPQDPLASLNPLFPVGEQVANSFRFHRKAEGGRARDKAIDVLRQVGIDSPEHRAHQYPHQLSGGMRQRVTIAMAIAAGPSLLIADEPTSALDVTIQRQIINLIDAIRRQSGMALLFITHDLALAAELADRVMVMYSGRVVEAGKTNDVLGNPQHPYTQGLLASVPDISQVKQQLVAISGVPPDPLSRPRGCPFHPRCPHAMPVCSEEYPELTTLPNGRNVACWLQTNS